MTLEEIIGWPCLIIGAVGLLCMNINWKYVISKVKEWF